MKAEPAVPDHSPQARFSATAANYVTSPVHRAGYSLDTLVALVAPAPSKRALDVATGGGHVAAALAREGAAVIASDLTPTMLLAARQMLAEDHGLGAAYCLNDAQALPFPAECFDIVTTRIAPHHFPDVPRYLSECARVLRPSGVLGVVDHVGPLDMQAAKYVNAFETLRDPSHVWEFNQIEWEALFHEAGLRVTHSELWAQRINFLWWTKMQHNDAETVLRLRVLLRQMPAAVAEWMQPETPDDGDWSFTRWLVILRGEKR